MSTDFRRKIRDYELSLVISSFAKDALVLEIGGGAGWQAQRLANFGLVVNSIDVEQDSKQNYNYKEERIFPITIYDGKKIPFPDNFFDFVYSSNVLEHIPHIEEFEKEISRVLKSDGLCIHILPSATWRFWSFIGHYVIRILNLPKKIFRRSEKIISNEPQQLKSTHSWLDKIYPPRHGERGNTISEFVLFHKNCWRAHFERTGWIVSHIKPNKLIYSGEMIFGSLLTIAMRKRLSNFLGNACYIFFLKKNNR